MITITTRHWLKSIQDEGDTLCLDQSFKYEIYIKSLVIKMGSKIYSKVWIKGLD